MPRTTLNIDAPVMQRLRRLQRRQKKPLGELVSELLIRALADVEEKPPQPRELRWNSQPMGARVDLRDKDAVWAALDGTGRR
jgi:hypothetical protein